MKTIKVAPPLIAQLRNGTKTTTWRLFDDKDLTEGDRVTLVDKVSLREVGTAHIASVVVKTLGGVTEAQLREHGYDDADAMYANLRGFYGERVTPETEVKMITFENIVCTPTDL